MHHLGVEVAVPGLQDPRLLGASAGLQENLKEVVKRVSFPHFPQDRVPLLMRQAGAPVCWAGRLSFARGLRSKYAMSLIAQLKTRFTHTIAARRVLGLLLRG